MIRISAFKSTKAAACIVLISGVLACIGTAVLHLPFLVLLGILVYMIWGVMIIALLSAVKYRKILSVINDQCQVELFITKMQELMNYNYNNRNREIFALNLSAGYLHLGDSESAKQVLDSVKINSERRSELIHLIMLYNNLAVYYMQVEDFDNAKKSLDVFNDILFKGDLKEKDKKRYSHYYTRQKHIFHVNARSFNEERSFFEKEFWAEKTIIGKVHIQYLLGLIYLHEQEDKKAKDAFEYTIAHGGDSYYSRRAKNYLGQQER